MCSGTRPQCYSSKHDTAATVQKARANNLFLINRKCWTADKIANYCKKQ